MPEAASRAEVARPRSHWALGVLRTAYWCWLACGYWCGSSRFWSVQSSAKLLDHVDGGLLMRSLMCLPTQSQHAHATQRTTERGRREQRRRLSAYERYLLLKLAQRAQAFRNHEPKRRWKIRQLEKRRPVRGPSGRPGDKREYTGANKSAVWI